MNPKDHTILLVDDEKDFLDPMVELLSAEGYKVVPCSSGKEATEQLKKSVPFSAVITDYKMPVMKGTELLRIARELFPHIPRIMITAYQDAEMMKESINEAEVFRFLTKPIDIGNVLSIVKSAVEKYENHVLETRENKQRDELIRKINEALEQSPLTGKGQKTKESEAEDKGLVEGDAVSVDMFDMIASLSTALDIINPALNDHHKRVCYIASCLAEELNLPTKEVSTIFMASIMHDIGAIVLTDRFKLLEFEDKSPHAHAELGALLLASFPPFASFAPLVRYHHVPWNNGEGKTFRGGTVPLSSHIIHLADRVAVLINKRKPIFKQTPFIREKVSSGSGKKFVPEYVEAFLNLSTREAFWLDTVSAFLDHVLREKSQLPDISLDLDGLEELTRFYSMIIDTRSHFTANHSSGVSACAEELAVLMNMAPVECRQIKIAGYLHDLGKLAVPSAILEKPDRLNEEEMAIIKSHTYHTYTILKEVKGLEKIVAWAALHHETLRGDGYPFHRSATELPLGSRVLAIADIFTALTEDRPYRKGMERSKVQEIFSKMSDEGKIDKSIVNMLMENYERINLVRERAQTIHSKNLSDFWKRSKELMVDNA